MVADWHYATDPAPAPEHPSCMLCLVPTSSHSTDAPDAGCKRGPSHGRPASQTTPPPPVNCCTSLSNARLCTPHDPLAGLTLCSFLASCAPPSLNEADELPVSAPRDALATITSIGSKRDGLFLERILLHLLPAWNFNSRCRLIIPVKAQCTRPLGAGQEAEDHNMANTGLLRASRRGINLQVSAEGEATFMAG